MTKKQNSSPSSNRSGMLQYSKLEVSAGPLPHPDILKRYEEILPGLADRIVKQAENQTEHRIKIEKEVVHSNIRKSYLGLTFGFILGLMGIGGGIYLTTLGNDTFGPLLSGGTLVTLVAAFIYGSQSRKNERIERFKESRK